jgi:hypothetical protein
MGSEMQPGVMRAQKREIQISRVKILIFSVKKFTFSMELDFLQLFSKLILKHVISFMNRKSSFGYAIRNTFLFI